MTLSLPLPTVLATLAGATLATAQSATIAPAGTPPTGDAPSMTALPGFDHAGRSMILIDEAQLSAARGRVVHTLALRRDASRDVAFPASATDLTVDLSIAPHAANRTAATFAANLGTPSRVFSGRLALPASPTPVGRSNGFGTTTDVVEIRLQQPFLYAGGTLCIDLHGRPVAGSARPWWPFDAVTDPARGQATRVGAPCGARTATLAGAGTSSSLSAFDTTLVAGSSTAFAALGNPGAAGAILIGLGATDVDLAAFGLGAPGCRLRVLDAIAVPGTYRALGPLPYGSLDVATTLPVATGVRGSSFRVQAVEFGASITTSEAIDCTIAPALPALGMALLRADGDGVTPPAAGDVETWRAPVVQLGF